MIFFIRARFDAVSVRMSVLVGPYDSRLLSFDTSGDSNPRNLVHLGEFQGDESGHEGVAASRRQGPLVVRSGGNRVVLGRRRTG